MNYITREDVRIKKESRWLKLVATIVLLCASTLVCNILLSAFASFFEALVPANNQWAVAMIAIPIAFFGIYISVLLAVIGKYNSTLCGWSTNDIYKSVLYWFDFSNLFLWRLGADAVSWFLNYVVEDYAGIIAYSFVMTLDLSYLIVFNLWKYKLSIVRLLTDATISRYKLYKHKKRGKAAELVEVQSSSHTLQTIEKYVRANNPQYVFFLDFIMMEIIGSAESLDGIIAWTDILSKISKKQNRKQNVFCNCVLLSRSMEIARCCYERKDYHYFRTIIIQCSNIWRTTVVCVAENDTAVYKKISPIFDNFQDLTLKEAEDFVQAESSLRKQQMPVILYLTDIYTKIQEWKSKINENDVFQLLPPSNATWNEIFDNNAQLYNHMVKMKEALTAEQHKDNAG
jgi:hypothetical protein